MAKKVVLIGDPGIDTSFALALALLDPTLDVLAVCATAGNVSAEQATRNVYYLINRLDPPRWPRLGAALPLDYGSDGRELHGPWGLGPLELPDVAPHQPTPADRLIGELVHAHPGELTVVCLGPLTALAAALDRWPGLAAQVERLVVVGGTWHEPGNATAAAEFHFHCDPPAARKVLHAGAPLTVVPLDVTRKVVFAPTQLDDLPPPDTAVGGFLREVLPFGIRATSNRYGVEGFHLKDVLGVVAAARPDLLTTRSLNVDVETSGELTRGMSVVDARPGRRHAGNCDWTTAVDAAGVHEYTLRTLRRAE